MTDTLLIVGGGFGQLPAIHTARKLGVRTLVVDRDPQALGMSLADVALPIDVLDRDGVVAAARAYGITGAMTMQSDIGVPTVGAVIDALGLPGNGLAVAERCSSKIATRRSLAERGVPQPAFAVVTCPEQARAAARRIGLPCIVKAPDSSGSRGVVKVARMEQVEPAMAEARCHTRGREILVEEYIAGTELGAQAFSIDGRCAKVLVHDDLLSEPPYMIPIAHAFPATIDAEALVRVEQAVEVCVEALGIVSGPSNIDLIIDSEGIPRIIEVGARIGATCLPELVFHHTGIDWTAASILAALGRPVNLEQQHEYACAAFILEAPASGTFRGHLVPADQYNDSDILEWEVTARVGERVACLTKGTDRIGKVVARGRDPRAALARADSFRRAVCFDIETEPTAGTLS